MIHSGNRAQQIDWIYSVIAKLGFDDRSLYFRTVNLIDRYYDTLQKPMPASDLQLTSITCLFICCKTQEVDPIDLEICRLLSNKSFSKIQFLEKEAHILQSVKCDLDIP